MQFNSKISKLLGIFKKSNNKLAPKEFYGNGKNAGFQSYYRENKEQIWQGILPKRYEIIANLVPGDSILEIGSADGTQALTLAQQNKSVLGVEMMEMQFAEALQLKEAWRKLGKSTDNCTFLNGNVIDLLNSDDEKLLKQETVLMSRVIYHLREEIPVLLDKLRKSDVINVVLVGCPQRESRWRKKGDEGDPMGKFARYASLEGMCEIAERINFNVKKTYPSGGEAHDPIVIMERK